MKVQIHAPLQVKGGGDQVTEACIKAIAHINLLDQDIINFDFKVFRSHAYCDNDENNIVVDELNGQSLANIPLSASQKEVIKNVVLPIMIAKLETLVGEGNVTEIV